MTIETALVTHLTGTSAAVAAIIGDRCYPDHLPQDVTLPAVRYQGIDRPEFLANPRVTTLRLVQKRIQIDAFAASYSAVKTLEAALIPALYAFNHAVDSSIVGTQVVDQRDLSDAEQGVYRSSIDIIVNMNE